MNKRLLFLLIFWGQLAFGQNKQLLYNFDELPQNLMTNPGAEVPFDLHAGLPFFSQVHFSAGSSGVSVYDIFKVDDKSINQHIRTAISKMDSKDFFTVNQQLELLSLGWRGRNEQYYSAGIYQETDGFLYFPKDLAILAFEGTRDHLGKAFHFNEAALTAELLNVFHFGMTKNYSEDLNYGFRVKLYSSVINVRSTNNRGSFRTTPTPAGPNRYRHFLNGIDLMVRTSGLAALEEPDSTNTRRTIRELAGRAFLGGNLGLGLDLGFTHYFNDRWKVTGSLLDIGFVNHKKEVKSYRFHGNYETDGMELIIPGPGDGSPDYIDDWEDELRANLEGETLFDSYLSWRPLRLNASIDYGFVEETEPCNCHEPSGRRKYRNHIGFHWFAIKRPHGFIHAATLSFDKRFSNNFRARIAYTADAYSFSNIGLMFSTRIKSFNFYLAADNLLDYSNLAKANGLSVQLGLQLLMNKS